MSELSISVAMATYNGERFLREQLDSFVAQTRQPDELVVTDDGSTDGTLKILEDFRSSAPFDVKIYRNSDRLGHNKNFEKALSLCSGDVIFLSDQDDVWLAAKIAQVSSHFLTRQRIMAVVNDQIVTDENLSTNSVTALQNIRSVGLGDGNLISGCCTAVRREWRDLVLPVPAQGVAYDCWINTFGNMLGVRLTLSDPLQMYRRHSTNTSNWFVISPRKVSALDVLRLYGLRDARTGWIQGISVRKLYRQRLADRTRLLRSLQLEEAQAHAARRLSQEIKALERRIALMDVPRWRRLPAVLKFSIEGGYGHFWGWKSALKDVLR